MAEGRGEEPAIMLCEEDKHDKQNGPIKNRILKLFPNIVSGTSELKELIESIMPIMTGKSGHEMVEKLTGQREVPDEGSLEFEIVGVFWKEISQFKYYAIIFVVDGSGRITGSLFTFPYWPELTTQTIPPPPLNIPIYHVDNLPTVAVSGGYPQKAICAGTAVLLFSSQQMSRRLTEAAKFIPSVVTQIEKVASIVMLMPRQQSDSMPAAKKARLDTLSIEEEAEQILCRGCGSCCQEKANRSVFDTMLCTSCGTNAPLSVVDSKNKVTVTSIADGKLALPSSSDQVATLTNLLEVAQADVEALQDALKQADNQHDELLDKLSSSENNLVAFGQEHKDLKAISDQKTRDLKSLTRSRLAALEDAKQNRSEANKAKKRMLILTEINDGLKIRLTDSASRIEDLESDLAQINQKNLNSGFRPCGECAKLKAINAAITCERDDVQCKLNAANKQLKANHKNAVSVVANRDEMIEQLKTKHTSLVQGLTKYDRDRAN